MSRWKAGSIHLGISIAIVGTILAFLILVWYPGALLHATRADRLLGILAGVDIVVGPALTLLIFRTGKRGLKIDLTIIGLLQALGLAYGIWTMWQSRPVFLVGNINRFDLVFANEIHPDDLKRAELHGYGRLPPFGAALVAIRSLDDPALADDSLFSGASGLDADVLPWLYVDYAKEAARIAQHAVPIDELVSGSPQTGDSVQRLVAGRAISKSLGYLPVYSRRGSLLAVVEVPDGKLVGLIANPSPDEQPDNKPLP